MIELFDLTHLRADILRHLSLHPEGSTSGEVGRALAANYRTVARHLTRLEALGVVESDAPNQRQGIRVLYRINPERLALAAKLLLRYVSGG